ncbi:MAG: hypothetical protein MK212_21790, partial [Saprospiraceae bacterium]|nr:hypothetical protein [Saprospiraceae bacterium]
MLPHHFSKRVFTKVLIFFLCSFTIPVSQHTKQPSKGRTKISQLGKYSGYATKNYKGFEYSSQYVTMPDEVKLAVDIFLPKKR